MRVVLLGPEGRVQLRADERDGVVSIAFVRQLDQPIVNGIEIVPSGAR